MKNQKQILTVIMAIIISFSSIANNIKVIQTNGQEASIEVDKNDIRKKGIKSGKEAMIYFENINTVSTDDFEIYDMLVNKTKNRYATVKVEYTGEGNVHSLKLEKLKKRRTGADVTRAAGGVMMILGVLSGDRGLTAAGLATNGAGRIARNVNDDRTSNTQTEMLNDLEKRTKAAEQINQENELKNAYGDENVEGLKALIDGNHDRAIALANAGETSDIEDYRISAVYLKAMIAVDQNDADQEEVSYIRMVEMDSELDSIEEAKDEISDLVSQMKSFRSK